MLIDSRHMPIYIDNMYTHHAQTTDNMLIYIHIYTTHAYMYLMQSGEGSRPVQILKMMSISTVLYVFCPVCCRCFSFSLSLYIHI